MIQMLLTTAGRLVALIRQVLFPARFPGTARYLQRLTVCAVFLPAFVALQALHWLGFLLDEIFFRRYRQTEIREPVFIVGAPRSGTTYLHRLLAADDRYTTFATWECLFAPSITERRLWSGLAAADRAIGGPLATLCRRLGRSVFGWINDKHPLGLTEPEEDYFCFLPVLCCFVLIVPFPEARWVWRMGTFDRDVPENEKRRLLRWYRRCVQKHLYAHGPERIFLSKNAAFAGMVGSLAAEYPDARFVICERDAMDVIASQFNSLTDGLRLFGVRPDDAAFRRRLLGCLDFYYANLDTLRRRLPPSRVVTAPMAELGRDPQGLVRRLYSRLGLTPGAALEARLETASRGRARHVPAVAPPLSAWGIDRGEVMHRFATWTRRENQHT